MYKKGVKYPVKWGHNNKKYYESLGYKFTKYKDVFFVNPEELPKGYKEGAVFCICDRCGKEYTLSNYCVSKYRDVYEGIDLCTSCKRKLEAETRKPMRAKEAFDFLDKYCKEKGYTLLTKEEDYSGNQMNIDFICPIHGKQKAKLVSLKQGCGCVKCGYERVSKMKMHSTKYIKEMIESVNGNILLNPEDYIGTDAKNLKILCGCCKKNIFTTSFSYYFGGGINKCEDCSNKITIGEKRMYDFFEDNNICYEPQKKFNDLKDRGCLAFDAYLPNLKICCEFDGTQHFKPVFGDEKFEYTKMHDKMKDDYCKQHGIKMIRIPYWETQNMETILKRELNMN